ncbi:MAG: cupin domain-containing protein [Patescibacteria group bacterium]|nr:cupin domain-containing protein [Patescibacteria group bacterium]
MKYRKATEGQESVKKDYSKKLIFSLKDMSEYPGHALQTVTIPPHTKQRNHFHMQQTEVAYILSGTATYVVNDISHSVSAGDVIVDEPNETHYIVNETDKPFIILVFKINMPSDSDDTTWLET